MDHVPIRSVDIAIHSYAYSHVDDGDRLAHSMKKRERQCISLMPTKGIKKLFTVLTNHE